MKIRLLTAIILTASICSGVIALGQEADSAKTAKRADIKKLMEVTGAGDLGIQVMNQLIAAFKQGNKDVPDKFWDDVMAEIDSKELIEMCIPSYENHFTHEEIKQLLAFFETPLGKKLIKTQPEIMQECMMAGQEWGRKLGDKVLKKLQAGGY